LQRSKSFNNSGLTILKSQSLFAVDPMNPRAEMRNRKHAAVIESCRSGVSTNKYIKENN